MLGCQLTSGKALPLSLLTRACGGRPLWMPSHFAVLEHQNDTRLGSPLLHLPRVSPAWREPSLVKAVTALLTTPSSQCSAGEADSISLGMPTGGCKKGFITQLHETGKYSEPTSPISFSFLCLSYTHTYSARKIKLLVSYFPILVASTVLLALGISKAPGACHSINPPGTNILLFHCPIIQFVHQNFFHIPQHSEADTENKVGCYIQKEGILPSIPECLHFPTPFRSRLRQVTPAIPTTVTF